MFYPRSLGYANNLNVGDKLYQDALLTTGILAGTYYQVGSSATTTICNAGYENTFVVDSNSLITSKVCA